MDVNEELIKEIERLVAKDPHTRSLIVNFDEPTRYMPEYEKVWKLFQQSKYRVKFERKWKFSQLVRAIVDENKPHKLYMQERLWSLLLEYRNSPDDYFEIDTDDGLYSFPNPLSELNRLEMLYDEFLPIFNSIKNRID